MKCRPDCRNYTLAGYLFLGVILLFKQSSFEPASYDMNSQALSLLLMENFTSAAPNTTAAENNCHMPFPSRLHQFVAGICLRNPFWNDFRLLSFFAKRGIQLTIESLQQLKIECGVASKASVCRILMDMYLENSKNLSAQQIGFIERMNPLFCDRDIISSAPGDLLLYECICVRRMSRKIKGMLYLHLFIDIFNGYAFGQFSQQRSREIGLSLVQKEIIPFYTKHSCTIAAILYSKKGLQGNIENSLHKKWPLLTCKWKEINRPLGTIQGFCKFVLSDFFEGMRLHDASYTDLHAPFTRWLRTQNAGLPFHERCHFLDSIDFLYCSRLSLD
jgi:hypothetical protein